MTTTTPQPSPRTSTPKCGLKMHRRGIIWLRLASITSAVYFMAMNCLTSLEVTTSSSAQKTSLFNIYHDTSHQQRRENYIRQAFPKERIKQNAVKVEDDDDELETDRVVLDSTRQNRTRPLLSLAPSSDAFQMTLLPGTIYNEALLIHVDRRQNLNVTMLCENAGLQSSSRVTIGGLLTQPPSQALVLFLAKHCGVKSILGIDPLFPNHASNRVKAMQDYQQLVHGIEELRLLVPLANFSNDDAIVNSIVDFNTTHLVSIMTFPPDHSKVLTDQGRASYDTQSGLRALQRLLLSVTQLKSNSADAVAPSFVHVTSLDSKDSIWAQSASVMLSAVRDVSVTHLQVPFLFGPLVAPELDSSKVPVEQQMFVDQAVVSILKAMEQTSHPTTMSSYRRMETFSTDNTITEHMEVYRSETRD